MTITGVDDPRDDGTVEYTLELGPATSADAGYEGLDPDDVVTSTVDDDQTGLVVSSPSDDLVESTGSMATFTVRLATLPSSDVTFTVAPARC